MPEEDDDALGQMLGDRIRDTKDGSTDDTAGSPEQPDDPEAEEEQEGTESPTSRKQAESTQPQETPSEESEEDTESKTEDSTVRSRSPFPLYVTPEVKGTVQDRFEKFNAQRTLNDEPQVEKHKHFMEGLLRAGLDHPDLEEYVLEEFENK
jgi:hypothetical protein